MVVMMCVEEVCLYIFGNAYIYSNVFDFISILSYQ